MQQPFTDKQQHNSLERLKRETMKIKHLLRWMNIMSMWEKLCSGGDLKSTFITAQDAIWAL